MELVLLDSPNADDNLVAITMTKSEARKLRTVNAYGISWSRSGTLGEFAAQLDRLLLKAGVDFQLKQDEVVEPLLLSPKGRIHVLSPGMS